MSWACTQTNNPLRVIPKRVMVIALDVGSLSRAPYVLHYFRENHLKGNAMLQKSLIVALALFISTLVGCASPLDYKSGTSVSPDVYARFIEHKTSKTEVISTLGEPQKVRTEDGNTIYVYSHDVISAVPFQPNTNQTVVFSFDAKGILNKKSRTEGNELSSNPLLGK